MPVKSGRLLITLAVGLLALCSVSCYGAEAAAYDLEELGFSIEIPDQFYVFTRETPADDPGYEACGLEKGSMDDLMEEGNIYLNALAWPDFEYEIVVTKISSELNDFRNLSDSLLKTMASNFETGFANVGQTFIGAELYNHPQAKFIKVHASQELNGSEVYRLQYYTVYDKQAINITFHSYTGSWEEKYEELLKAVVDSMDFWRVEEKSDPFPYTYAKTGLQFTVPAGWKEKPLSKERDFLVAKFVPAEEGGDSILFGCADYWAEMPAEEKRGYTRAELDNSLLTELRKELSLEEFAALFCGEGVQVEKISAVSYGGQEYTKVDQTETVSAYGIEISVAMTSLLRVENGYLYSFQFSGTDTSWYYSDFETLLNSVSYPPVPSPPSRSSSDDSGVVATLVIGGVLIVALLFLPGVLSGRKKTEKAKAVASGRSTPPAAPAWQRPPEPEVSESKGNVCRQCGKAVSRDSVYCPCCGEKMAKEEPW